jgi:hypothetical protein
VISSSTLERKHKCDPRVRNDSGILHMDRATLARLGGSIGRLGDLHVEALPGYFPPFVISCIKYLKVQVQLVIDKICFMTCLSSFKPKLLIVF